MKLLLSLCLSIFLTLSLSSQDTSPTVIQWNIDRLDTIAGMPVTLIGNPVIIETKAGSVMEFDGVNDGILLNSNPMAGTNEFTIEVVFKPYPGGLVEQRFVHMEQDNNNRALIELRSTTDDNWFLDTFIKSGSSNHALYAEDFHHATNLWWNASLVYKDNVMTHYVNGVKELSGEVIFKEVSSGKTSLGVRQNKVSWYKGVIQTLRVTHKALTPDEFINVDTLNTVTALNEATSEKAGITSSIFPNPLTQNASLSFTIPEKSNVKITLYNAQAIPVDVLLNSVYEKGQYSTPLQRNNLPVGVYFYAIEMNNNKSVNKFIIQD